MDRSTDSDEWAVPLGVFKFPCARGLKVPALQGSWRDHATDDAGQHAEWLAQGCNLAVDCERSGWAVIDVDGGDVGEASLAALEAEHGPLPPTLETKTPGGGRHLIFYGSIASTVRQLGSKLDTRSCGGYVLVPPSVVNGAPYSLLHDRPIATLPDWVGEILARPNEPTTSSSAKGAPIGLDCVREALSYLDPDCSRDEWRDIVAAIRAAPIPNDEDEAARRELSHTWSEGQLDRARRYEEGPPPSYKDAVDVDRVFDTMPPKAGGIGVGSLISRARAAGFNRPLDAPDPTNRFAGFALPAPSLARVTRAERFALRSEAVQDARRQITWMVDGLLQDPCTIVIFARWNSYKSFAALDIALAVASGEPAFGHFRVIRSGPVIYMAGEGASGIETQRRPAWRAARGIEPGRVLPFYTVECVPLVKSEADIDACKTAIREAIAANVIERPALIVIDTLARAMAGLSANDEGDAGLFLTLAEDLKAEFGCATLTVAHEGKERERGIRGSSALPAGFDILLKMNADSDALTATIECPKIKDGSPIEKFGLRGREVDLGDGRKSLVFDWADRSDFRGPKPKTLTSQDVGTALKLLGAEHGVTVTTDRLAATLAEEFSADEKVVKAKAKALQRGRHDRFAAYVVHIGKGHGDSTLWTLPAPEAECAPFRGIKA